MEEARSSWNTIYQSKEGFECQVTLRDENEVSLIGRAREVMASVTKSGGIALKRWNHIPTENKGGIPKETKRKAKSEKPEKSYVDKEGVRCCKLKLKNGKTCDHPVTERQGRYGPFWSCPNYKEHAA